MYGARAQRNYFEASLSWLARQTLADIGNVAPPCIPDFPPLPDRWPAQGERIRYGGWAYGAICAGLYHAWPTDWPQRDLYLIPWMELADHVVGTSMPSLDERGGPLLTGVLFAVGQVGGAADQIYLPDGVSVPVRDPATGVVQIAPIIALSAPDPLITLFGEIVRSHGQSGRIAPNVYLRMATEPAMPEADGSASHSSSRSRRIGNFRSAIPESDGRFPQFFIQAGTVLGQGLTTFKVTPDMIRADAPWPLELTRDHLLGRLDG